MAETTPPATTAAQLAGRDRSVGQRIQHLLHAHPSLSPALILLATFVVFSLMNSKFATAQTMSLLVQQAAVVAILAVGTPIVLVARGIVELVTRLM